MSRGGWGERAILRMEPVSREIAGKRGQVRRHTAPSFYVAECTGLSVSHGSGEINAAS